MDSYNTQNEIIKKQYESHLELGGRLSPKTVYQKIKSLRKYEEFTGFKDFKTFNQKQGLEFKESYKEEEVSYHTKWRVLEDIKAFFLWLARQQGYKRSINVDNIQALNLTKKEELIADVRRIKKYPTLEQVKCLIKAMPSNTEKEKRDRAIIAFAISTGARIAALMTLKIRSVDDYQKVLEQDPNVGVKTKKGKYIVTRFFPVGEEIEAICLDWLKYLKEERLFGLDDPLFPAMKSEVDEMQNFKRDKLSKRFMTSDTNMRRIFEGAFEEAGMQYHNPHSFRDTLIALGYKVCKTPEEFKAWSQNVGHQNMLTTFTAYGTIDPNRQIDIIGGMGEK
ncbi:MAG: tyrosine-type recombinase/integrase [Alphaproteobacteria bacterium]